MKMWYELSLKECLMIAIPVLLLGGILFGSLYVIREAIKDKASEVVYEPLD